ncbi:tRNA-(ms[2]io[6]A)-hydroxylase [Oligoflexus sp.]|uniref:tRNA-(ms[2]io[6]A)-hydroxylase n=1 Tax=Oligoflexus sp. TaxID=1971216 RepID=UPI002D7A11F1|nr:tRNA-(ms[2]io[6]A)-hydroxylase [Oligoflexus sp.]
MPLREPTPTGWLEVVMNDFPSFMQDHASCERKASANALSLVNKFPEFEALIEPMICLAKEELAHFHEVYRILHKRGIPLGVDVKDPYVTALLKPVRHSREEYFLDRLLVGCLIEARSCERFTIVAEGLQDSELAPFYQRLAREEAGHFRVFLRLARHYFSEQKVYDRLQYLLDIETTAMLSAPVRAAVH